MKSEAVRIRGGNGVPFRDIECGGRCAILRYSGPPTVVNQSKKWCEMPSGMEGRVSSSGNRPRRALKIKGGGSTLLRN
jgi:hypothetical protein